MLTDNLDHHVFDPDELIIETETLIDLWIIAGLIVRQHHGLNNDFEEYYLNHWVYADEQNLQLYKDLQHPAFMQKMLVWNRLKRDSLSL